MGESGASHRVVLATRSAGKIRELTALCVAEGFEAVTLESLGLHEEAAEAGIEAFDTFEENAAAKVSWFAAKLTGQLVLGEDSGLVVRALGGAPGVHSKRWSKSTATGKLLDAENNAALLRAMASHADRAAHYACVAVLQHDARRWSARGETHGVIVGAPRGAGGFGYDPYFESVELGVTFAEASLEEKARVSHRARAVRGVLEQFRAARRGDGAAR